MKIKTNRFAVAAAILLALCLVFVAPVGATDTVTTSEGFKTAVTANEENIVVTLGADVSYDISAWENFPLGGERYKNHYH